MSSPSRLWTLAGFGPVVEAWIDRDQPCQDLRLVVSDWILSRCEDPYLGVRRERGFPNLWYGTVPFSRHGNDLAVMVVYWIKEHEHTVQCESVTTLGLPH